MKRPILLAVCVTVTMIACGDEPEILSPDDPLLRRGGLTVEILDPPAELMAGDSVALEGRVSNPTGRAVGADVTWTSSAPAVAVVAKDGLLRAVGGGAAEIGARVGRFEDAFTLTVKVNTPPVAGMADPETAEDTPVVFELEGTDETDPTESLRAYVERVPEAGRLFQVGEDGTIDRDAEIVVEDDSPAEVTNAGRLVGWDPPADAFGDGETVGSGFAYYVRDPRGLRSNTHEGVIDVTPVPDAPVAADADYETDEDEALEVEAPGVLGGDTDADGDALAAAVIAGPEHGSLSLEADGSFVYTPAADFNGTDGFTYEAADGTGLADTAAVAVVVAAVNDAPVSEDDGYETDEDATLEVAAPGVLENDGDVDGDALTAAVADGPSHGSLTLSGDGSFSYTPDAGFNGEDAFTYTANDGTVAGDAATVTITVHAVDPLAAHDDAYTIKAGHFLTVPAPGVLDNDEGEGVLTASLLDGPAKGELTLEADGSFTYAPPSPGVYTFTYEVTDGAGTETATVTVEVTPNHKPVAEMERPVGIEDTPHIFELEGYDPDGEQDTLRVYVTEAPLFGQMYQVLEDGTCDYDDQIFGSGDTITLVKNGDGLVCYVPPKDASGDGSDIGSSFVYFVRDQHNSTSTSLLDFVDIEPVNDAPVAAPTVHTAVSHLEVAGLTLDFDDVDVGDQLTGVITRFPENGTLHRSFVVPEDEITPENPSNEITPENPTFPSPGLAYSYERNSVGEPFDSFEWYVVDEAGERSEVVEDVINIVDVNDPPNPVCPEGTEYDETGHPVPPDTGEVLDGFCSPTDVVAQEDSPDFLRLGAVDDADDDGQSIRFAILSVPDPEHIRLRDSSNRLITSDSVPHVLPSSFTQFGWKMSYFPAENYHNEGAAPDSFTYIVYDVLFDDATGEEVILDQWPDTLTVRIHIEAVNDAPIAGDDAHETDEDTPLQVAAPGVLGNDTDVEGDALSAVLESGPSHGTLQLAADGSFSYTPDANFFGTDAFTYRASDGVDAGNAATVTLTVRSIEDGPPASEDDAYQTLEDVALEVAAPGVLANDTDPDGGSLAPVLESGPSHGMLDLEADGSFSYTPEPDFHGSDSFTYVASDGVEAGNTATVSITVESVNDVPVANDDEYEMTAGPLGATLSIGSPGVLANDTDADGDGLQAILERLPQRGQVTLSPDGAFDYTPDQGFQGTDTFTYRVSDGEAESNTATVTILVR